MIKTLEVPVLLVMDDIFQEACHKKLQKTLTYDINLRGIFIPILPNNEYIKQYSNTTILGITPKYDTNINPNDFIAEILTKTDIEKIFDVKIAKLEL